MADNQEPKTPEELVKYIASNLVENTDENDKGKIIGKNGKIAKSIRNVLKLASTKDKNRYILEII